MKKVIARFYQWYLNKRYPYFVWIVSIEKQKAIFLPAVMKKPYKIKNIFGGSAVLTTPGCEEIANCNLPCAYQIHKGSLVVDGFALSKNLCSRIIAILTVQTKFLDSESAWGKEARLILKEMTGV